MRARVKHFTGNKLHFLHLNYFPKCCFSIFTLFSFGFALYGRFFLLHTQLCISTVYEMRHSVFPTVTV